MAEKTAQLHISDATWQEFKAGDRAAFRDIYDRYVGFVQFSAQQFKLPVQEADEVVQEVFLRLYIHRSKLQHPGALPTWLVATTRNLVIDHQRKQKHERLHQDSAEAENPTRITSQESLQRELEIVLVQNIIASISKEDGGADFRKFYIQGDSVKDIASENGEAVSTVTTRLTRMRRKFGDLIRKEIEELQARIPKTLW